MSAAWANHLVLDGPGEEVSGDLGVPDRGLRAQGGRRRQVQRIGGVNGEGLLQNAVGAKVLKWNVLHRQVPLR
jgi:hypothetical protein